MTDLTGTRFVMPYTEEGFHEPRPYYVVDDAMQAGPLFGIISALSFVPGYSHLKETTKE